MPVWKINLASPNLTPPDSLIPRQIAGRNTASHFPQPFQADQHMFRRVMRQCNKTWLSFSVSIKILRLRKDSVATSASLATKMRHHDMGRGNMSERTRTRGLMGGTRPLNITRKK